MPERWVPVLDYEGLYEVSDRGRVRSVRTGKALSGRSIKNYLWVALYKDGKRKDRAIHLLVLEAFVGPCPPGHESFHKNDLEWDNRLENLRWDTRSANQRHARRAGKLTVKERLDMIRQGL